MRMVLEQSLHSEQRTLNLVVEYESPLWCWHKPVSGYRLLHHVPYSWRIVHASVVHCIVHNGQVNPAVSMLNHNFCGPLQVLALQSVSISPDMLTSLWFYFGNVLQWPKCSPMNSSISAHLLCTHNRSSSKIAVLPSARNRKLLFPRTNAKFNKESYPWHAVQWMLSLHDSIRSKVRRSYLWLPKMYRRMLWINWKYWWFE